MQWGWKEYIMELSSENAFQWPFCIWRIYPHAHTSTNNYTSYKVDTKYTSKFIPLIFLDPCQMARYVPKMSKIHVCKMSWSIFLIWSPRKTPQSQPSSIWLAPGCHVPRESLQISPKYRSRYININYVQQIFVPQISMKSLRQDFLHVNAFV